MFINYKPNVDYTFKIPAVIYIKHRAVVALFFPPCDNAFEVPHLTLMICGFTTEEIINSVLRPSCSDPDKFGAQYDLIKNGEDYESRI